MNLTWVTEMELCPLYLLKRSLHSHHFLHWAYYYDFNTSPKNVIHKCTVLPIKDSQLGNPRQVSIASVSTPRFWVNHNSPTVPGHLNFDKPALTLGLGNDSIFSNAICTALTLGLGLVTVIFTTGLHRFLIQGYTIGYSLINNTRGTLGLDELWKEGFLDNPLWVPRVSRLVWIQKWNKLCKFVSYW